MVTVYKTDYFETINERQRDYSYTNKRRRVIIQIDTVEQIIP